MIGLIDFRDTRVTSHRSLIHDQFTFGLDRLGASTLTAATTPMRRTNIAQCTAGTDLLRVHVNGVNALAVAFASLKKSSARRSNSTPSRAASAKSSDPTASATAFHDSATAVCVCTSADGCAGASHRRILSHPSAHGDARFSAGPPR